MLAAAGIRRAPARVHCLKGLCAAGVQRRGFADLDAAVEKYYDNEKAYTSIPVDKIKFTVGKDFRGNAVPEVSINGAEATTGIRHLVPWARVKFALASPKGNLGRKEYGSEQVLRDPSKATQQILLGLEPLDDSEHFNKHMAGYISWLRSLEDKMAAHIMENLASYRALNNKYKSFASKDIFLANMSHAVKVRHDDQGEAIMDSEYVNFTHKIYWKSKKPANVDRMVLPLDKQVYNEHGLVRTGLVWFDAKGERIPLEKQRLQKGDIICIDSMLEPSMYEVNYGLKNKIRRVIVLQRAPITQTARAKLVALGSPFGNLEEAVAA